MAARAPRQKGAFINGNQAVLALEEFRVNAPFTAFVVIFDSFKEVLFVDTCLVGQFCERIGFEQVAFVLCHACEFGDTFFHNLFVVYPAAD